MNRLSLAEAHAMIEGLTEAQKEKLLMFLEKQQELRFMVS